MCFNRQNRLVRGDISNVMELGESAFNANDTESDIEIKVNMSQTDENKVAEQQISNRLQTPKPKVPCIADTGLFIASDH